MGSGHVTMAVPDTAFLVVWFCSYMQYDWPSKQQLHFLFCTVLLAYKMLAVFYQTLA